MLNYLVTVLAMVGLVSQATPPRTTASRLALQDVSFECAAPLVVAMQITDGYILANFDVRTTTGRLEAKQMLVIVQAGPQIFGASFLSQAPASAIEIPVVSMVTIPMILGDRLYTFSMQTRDQDRQDPELQRLFRALVNSVRLDASRRVA